MADGEQRPSGGDADENGREYPIGFRCKPTIEELVEFYLLPKLLDQPTVPNKFVIEEDAYACHPEILTGNYKERGVDDDSWYFLSPRYRKYPGGDRPVRRTADNRGRWKPSTGTSPSNPSQDDDANDASTSHSKAKKKQRLYVGDTAFTENTLAYYVGSTKHETKTKWLMHELVVPETPDNGFPNNGAGAEAGDGMLLNRYVACKIYKSPLRKWKEIDDDDEAAEEVPTSSQSSGSAPECVGEPSSSSQPPPAKRLAVERPSASGHTGGAPNMWVSQNTILFPDGRRPAPTRGNDGGGGNNGVRMPVGAGAGAAGRHGQGLPGLVHWPPVYNSMQGPVQVQRPPLIYGYGNGNRAAGMPNANGQAAPGQAPPVYKNKSMQGQVPVQRPPLVYGYGNRAAGMMPNANGQAQAPGRGPPVYKSMQGSAQVQRPPLVYGHGNRAAAGMANANGQVQAPGQGPPHRPAATGPNSLVGPTTVMRPPNLAAGQPAACWLPSPRQQRPPETEEEHRNRVYARLVAEMKLHKAQQMMRQTASVQPALFHDEGAKHRPAAGVEAVVPPPAQFPAPQGGHPYSNSSNLAQRSQQQQQQQSSSATPAAVVKPPAAENVPSESEQSVPPGGNEGSGNGDAATIARGQHHADLVSRLADMKN